MAYCHLDTFRAPNICIAFISRGARTQKIQLLKEVYNEDEQVGQYTLLFKMPQQSTLLKQLSQVSGAQLATYFIGSIATGMESLLGEFLDRLFVKSFLHW